jgi:predicted NBD/HSP70 family sugar kinase
VIDLKRIQAASNDVVRGINRRIVLNLVRTRQPISRADLARMSGMQRSTISLIVEELVNENWVIEGPTGRLPRGRRPTFLRLNEERVIIGVDLRPTQTTVALADVNGKFSSQETMPTPQEPAEAIAQIIERVERIKAGLGSRAQTKIEGIGISIPGRFDPAADRLVFAPNLGWRDVDLRGPVAAATGLDVEIENAANACVLAAVWFDRMDSCRNLVVVTVSEGIGTGIFLNGQLASGLSGMAGEFGHVPLDPEGPLCGCGSRGCWEVFGSNRAAVRYYLESSSQPAGLSFPDLLTLADQGDARAAKALEKMAHYLGNGMRMIVAGLSPERIIIVGDLTRSWQRFGPIIEAEVRAQVLPGGAQPQLIPVHEEGRARLRGTVALVLQKHFGDMLA